MGKLHKALLFGGTCALCIAFICFSGWIGRSAPDPDPTPIAGTVTPNHGVQGDSLNVTVTTVGDYIFPAIVLNFGPGITVKYPTQYISPTMLVANLTIAPTATIGTRDLIMTQPIPPPWPYVVIQNAFTVDPYIQPDLLIKKASEPDIMFAIDNVYQQVPAGDQIESLWIDGGTCASYTVKVQNDGTTTRTFVLKAVESPEPGWTITYKSGVDDITNHIRVCYTTRNLAPGESEIIDVIMCADNVVPPDPPQVADCKTVTIKAFYNCSDTLVRDAVQITTFVNPVYYPDLLIKRGDAPDSAYALSGVFQTTPSGGQDLPRRPKAFNEMITYNVKFVNEGNTTRTFVLKAGESPELGWTIDYKIGATSIRNALLGAGYTTPSLPPDGSLVITGEVTAGSSVPPGSTKWFTVSAHLDATDGIRDIVRATAQVSLPDLLIKRATEADPGYALNGIYQTSPAGDQIEVQNTNPGVAVSYDIKLENDTVVGSPSQQFILKASESIESNWTVVYKVGAADITAQIKSVAGYTTPNLPPGGSLVVTVEMTPGALVPAGSSKETIVSVVLESPLVAVRDAVKAVAVVNPKDQPDLLIKQATQPDSAYAINNAYQPIPTGDQIETNNADANEMVAYDVKLENDGNTVRTFVLKASESSEVGWTVAYKIGTIDISTAIRSTNGYTTLPLSPGECNTFTIEMTPGLGVMAGTTKSATVRVYLDTTDAAVRDAVRAITSVNDMRRADLLIKRNGEPDTAYALNNVYQSSPSGDQIETQSTSSNVTATFQVKLENDGNGTRSFVLRSVESGDGAWNVVYRIGTLDITGSIRLGYTTANLAPGTNIVVTIEMTPASSVPLGASKTATVSAYFDTTDTTVRDSVRAVTTVRGSDQPDLLVKDQDDPDFAYAMNDVYQTTPALDQVVTQVAEIGQPAVFSVKVENDGSLARSFVLKSTESSDSGWIVTYKVGDTDISPAIIGVGYVTSILAPGEFEIITVTIQPWSIYDGVIKTATIRAYLDGTDTTVRDVVQVVGSLVRVDLLIKGDGEPDSAYALNDIYQSTPAGDQVETQAIAPDGAALYWVKIENDGQPDPSFIVKAEESGDPGWDVRYLVDDTDITNQIRSLDGYATSPLYPGESCIIKVIMLPGNTVTGGSRSTTIRAFLCCNDIIVRDAVRATTSVRTTEQPDLLVRMNGEADAAYALDGVYQSVPSGGQICTQTTQPPNTAAYQVKLENDGRITRTFIAKCVESSEPGWTVVYRVGSNDISSALRGAGYTTPLLAPGANVVITVNMTPSTTVAGSTGKSATINVFLNSTDTTVRDAVQTTTLAKGVDQPDLLVKHGGELDSAYAIDNVYQQIPAGDQIETANTDQSGIATFQVKIGNDGITTRSFLVQANESAETNWTITYTVNGVDVTDAMRSTGYTTTSLVPGASEVITVRLVQEATTVGGTGKSVTLNARLDKFDANVRDAVKATAVASSPDLLIKSGTEGDAAFAIDNVYQTEPAGAQIEAQAVDPYATAVYEVNLENDGNVSRCYVLKATETAEPGWTATYLLENENVTARILSPDGVTTRSLAPQTSTRLVMRVTPDGSVPGGTGKSATIRAFLDARDTSVRDVVEAVTSAKGVDQPDLLIKRNEDPVAAYMGNDIYATTPASNQTVSTTINAGGSAIYNVKLQNDGVTTRTFALKAKETNQTGWTLVYKVGQTVITGPILSPTGYTTAPLAPGGEMVVTIEAFAGGDMPSGSSTTTTLKAFLQGTDALARDAVQAVTTARPSSQPDALIKAEDEPDSAFAINNVYQDTPSGNQIETQSVAPSETAVFDVKIENDSTSAQSFNVKAVESSASDWMVNYFCGTQNITARITSPTGANTPSLPAGSKFLLRIEMTPAATIAGGSVKSSTITVTGGGMDSVMAEAVAQETEQADLLIKKSSEPHSSYAIDNVYQTNPTGNQVESITVPAGTAARYDVKVENDGNAPRSFVVKASESPGAGWAVLYKMGSSDITDQVRRAAGYVTSTLSTGESEIITVEMTANLAGGAGASKETTLRVYLSETDTLVRDAVKAITYNSSVQRDLVLTNFAFRPNPVARGRNVTVQYSIRNQGEIIERGLSFRLWYGGKPLGKPIPIAGEIGIGAEIVGSFSVKVPPRTPPGEYLITGEVVPVPGEVNIANNRQTVKLTITR